jgi:hypothetical protein
LQYQWDKSPPVAVAASGNNAVSGETSDNDGKRNEELGYGDRSDDNDKDDNTALTVNDGLMNEKSIVRPSDCKDVSDDDLYDLFGIHHGDGGENETEKSKEREGSSMDENCVVDVTQEKFHFGNDDQESGKSRNLALRANDKINEVLGTSFSSEVHFEDLVPLSPKNSPKSPKQNVATPMVDLGEELIPKPSL